MPRELMAAFEPVVGDTLAYPLGAGDIVSHKGKDRFHMSGASVTTSSFRRMFTVGQPSIKTYLWPLLELIFKGTLNTNQRILLANFASVGAGGDANFVLAVNQKTDTSTYEILLGKAELFGGWTTRGTSSSTYSSSGDGDTLTIRAQFDGVRHKIWINGTLEIDIADTSKPTSAEVTPMNGHFNLDAMDNSPAQDGYVSDIQVWQSNLESDRPDDNPSYSVHHPDGDTSEDDYSVQGGPTDKFDAWNDMATVDETEYLLGDSGSENKQLSELPAGGAALVGTMGGVIWFMRFRAATSGKDADSFARIKDKDGTPNVSEITIPNEATGGFIVRAALFQTPPDGAADWSKFLSGNVFNHADADQELESGSRVPASNNVNMRFAEHMLVACAIGDDPPGPDEGHQDYPEANIPSNPLPKIVASGMTVGGEVE